MIQKYLMINRIDKPKIEEAREIGQWSEHVIYMWKI